LAVLAGKARRQRRFDLGPRHAGCQYRQRVAQIDHRVQPGAEKSGVVIANLRSKSSRK
jgi:hypothetical protein